MRGAVRQFIGSPLPHRARLCLSLAATLLLAPQIAAAKEAKFRITATWIVNYVEPQARSVMTRRSFTVTLKSDRSIEERVESQTGKRYRNPKLTQTDMQLGDGEDGPQSKAWKVVNETTLVRLVARNSHTFAIWLRTQGDHSCTTTLEWRLKPGFTVFEGRKRKGKPLVRFTEPSWPNARCDVL